MQVTNVIFHPPLPGADPRWVLQVEVEGSDFHSRAIPFVASVGNVAVEDIFLKLDGDGFVGLLQSLPGEGDELKIGYLDRELVGTGFTYQAQPPSV